MMRIRCIENPDNAYALTVGKIYDDATHHINVYNFHDDNNHYSSYGFHESYFEEVIPENRVVYNAGDILICIKPIGNLTPYKFLTLKEGKKYKVIEQRERFYTLEDIETLTTGSFSREMLDDRARLYKSKDIKKNDLYKQQQVDSLLNEINNKIREALKEIEEINGISAIYNCKEILSDLLDKI